jgi:hypothetical protein
MIESTLLRKVNDSYCPSFSEANVAGETGQVLSVISPLEIARMTNMDPQQLQSAIAVEHHSGNQVWYNFNGLTGYYEPSGYLYPYSHKDNRDGSNDQYCDLRWMNNINRPGYEPPKLSLTDQWSTPNNETTHLKLDFHEKEIPSTWATNYRFDNAAERTEIGPTKLGMGNKDFTMRFLK